MLRGIPIAMLHTGLQDAEGIKVGTGDNIYYQEFRIASIINV